MPIGLMKDLDNATLEYVQTFFHTYYAPNNAVLVLAGDFQPKTARGLIESYFGSIPRRPDPPKPDIAEPGTTRAKSESVLDPFATTPATLLAWPGPPAGDPDAPVLDLVYTLLFKQETQRCWADIGGGERWIYAFQGGLEDHPGPALFRVLTIHRSDIKSTTIRDEIFAQIRRLQNELPSKEEVDRVRTRFLADYYRREVEPLNTRAYNLAIGKLWMDAPDHFFTQMDRYLTITPEQIQAAAKKYLVPEKCTFLAVKTSKMKDEKEGTE
jgi:zinc protease